VGARRTALEKMRRRRKMQERGNIGIGFSFLYFIVLEKKNLNYIYHIS
jgi:hypothetical protein